MILSVSALQKCVSKYIWDVAFLSHNSKTNGRGHVCLIQSSPVLLLGRLTVLSQLVQVN